MQAYKIMARNTRGNQRVQRQDLSGEVVKDYAVAWSLAQQLAAKQTQTTGDPWVAEVTTYTVGHRPGSELL